MIAWAFYGAAKEWVQTPKRIPVPKIGETIEKIIMPILLSYNCSARCWYRGSLC